MNKLYEIMKEALLHESSGGHQYVSTVTPGQIFTTTNTAKPRVFMAVKGQRIFNIIKENHNDNRRKSVKIIYNGDENEEEYQYEDEIYEEEKEGDAGYEEYEGEEEFEEGPQGDDIFNAGHKTWDNYTAFK
jgi:hypothetical protein